jgi:hypothetical protein
MAVVVDAYRQTVLFLEHLLNGNILPFGKIIDRNGTADKIYSTGTGNTDTTQIVHLETGFLKPVFHINEYTAS